MLGPDHAASLEFDNFKYMVEIVRKLKISLGSSEKKILKSESTTQCPKQFVLRKLSKKMKVIYQY